MIRFFLISLISLLGAGCASSGFQTRALLRSPPPVPVQTKIENVPFVKQTNEDCGPSALAMVMQWAGQNITAEALKPQVKTEKKKGSLQSDLISAGRRHGLLAVQIEGLDHLIREISAGHPVVVFENLGLNWAPRWHYAVAFGYDLSAQEIILHSGSSPGKRLSLNHFERYWSMGGYWGLVVLPPSKMSVSASQISHLEGAVGLEQGGFPGSAEKVYKNILQRWPGSLAAYIGLGNITYQAGDFANSVKYLTEATRQHPESTVAKNNLTVAKEALAKISR